MTSLPVLGRMTEALASAPTAPPTDRPGTLRNREFRRLYVAAVASAGGAAVATVSISWLVYASTGSALAISYIGIAAIVPGLVLGLLAGVVADRYNRRRVMIASDLVRAVVVATLAIALYLLGFNLLLVLGVVVLINGFTALFFPASTAILPRLVPPYQLEAANGLLQASTQGAQMLGAAAGGAAIALAGAVPGLAVNALTYLVSAAFLLQIAASFGLPSRPQGAAPARQSVVRDVGEGFSYMRQHPAVLEATIGFLPANFLWTMVTSFTVVYVGTYFPGSPGAYGYLVAALGGGYAVGAVFAARTRLRRWTGIVMSLCVVAQGAIALGLTFSHLYPTSLALAAGLGASAGIVNTVFYATMGAVVPNEVLGRVISVDQVGSYAGIPAGLILGGVLAAGYGIGVSFAVAGIGLTVNGLAMISLPALRSLRYRTE